MSPRRLLLVALLGLAGCTTRDPANPLDPANPDTGGEPEWLEARADRGAVDLQWDVPFFVDLEAVQLRDTVRDSVLGTYPAGADTIRHAPLPDGVDAHYRLELVLDNGRVDPLGEVTATPGPAIPWVVDESNASLWRITPDGRERRSFVRVFDVSGLEVDPATGTVLVLEFFGGRVRTVLPDATVAWSAPVAGPFAAARAADGWWVADPITPALLRFSDDGEETGRDTSYRLPLDLSADATGRLWVADGPGGARRVDPGGGGLTVERECDRVLALADGGAWIYDSREDLLTRLDAAGEELVSRSWSGVDGLAADPLTPAGVWILSGPGGAVLLDGSAEVILQRREPIRPVDLAVSADGSRLWIADAAQGLLVIGRDGGDPVRTRGVNAGTWVAYAEDPAPGAVSGLPR